MDLSDIKQVLETEVKKRNKNSELSLEKPDPLFVARSLKDEYAILLCALFAYGNAKQIVKFLQTLDFTLLDTSEDKIKKSLKNHYYRFQNSEDIVQVFLSLKKMKENFSLDDIFFENYKKNFDVLEGISGVLEYIYKQSLYTSRGFTFLLGSIPKKDKLGIIKGSNSPYKRWNMFLRWMVRKDELDLGLWTRVRKQDLLMPLDTHTFKISQKLGLLQYKTYNLKAVRLLTKVLKEFDKNDPIKYDFALYRIGQEKIL